MTNNTAQEQIEHVVTDLLQLHPKFESLIGQLTEAITRLQKSKAASDLTYSGEYLTKVAYKHSLIKLQLVLEQNRTFGGTLSLLAITRHVFEVLVWLRVLAEEPKYGLVFYAQLIDDQIQHLKKQERKIYEEILLFESLHEEETQRDREAGQRILGAHADEPEKITEATATTSHFIMAQIDRKARRSFSLYADQAKHNGYGFQAHIMREKVLSQLQDQIDKVEEEWATFASNFPADICDLFSNNNNRKTTWYWKTQATRVGMLAQYQFLYSYTSRLLHATPVSIITEPKNLDLSETRMFLDYVYVSMLDALELGEKQC